MVAASRATSRRESAGRAWRCAVVTLAVGSGDDSDSGSGSGAVVSQESVSTRSAVERMSAASTASSVSGLGECLPLLELWIAPKEGLARYARISKLSFAALRSRARSSPLALRAPSARRLEAITALFCAH